MKNYLYVVVTTFCLFFSVSVYSEVHRVVGKVTRIVTFSKSYTTYSETSSGLTAIYVEGLPRGCETGSARVLIGVDHPVYQTAISIALTAYTTGQEVSLNYVDTCTQRGESWDFAYITLGE